MTMFTRRQALQTAAASFAFSSVGFMSRAATVELTAVEWGGGVVDAMKAYPRGCGGTTAIRRLACSDRGLSPRVRGNLSAP